MADAELLSLIGLIYDAALDPEQWHAAIAAICGHLGFHNSMMTLIELPTSRAIVSVQVNVPSQYNSMADPRYIASIVELWGGPERLGRHVIEEPIVLSSVSDATTWANNIYYNDFARPQGIIDVAAVALVRDRRVAGDIAFGRHQSAGRFGEAEIARLRLLAPHIRRAALVSGILDTAVTALATFEATVEATPAGVVLVGADGEIVYANSAAGRMLARRDPIRELDGRLELSAEVLHGQLAAAVAAAGQSALLMGRRGIGIPARRDDGSPLVLHVMPLSMHRGRGALFKNAVAAVFVAEAESSTPMSDALGLLFGLTPMEARVFELVAGGTSTKRMAETLDIASSTIRTHLLRVFEKTGRHRRVELAQLAREILP